MAKVDFAIGVEPISVAVGDLDRDMRPDLAITNWLSNTVSVLRNTVATLVTPLVSITAS